MITEIYLNSFKSYLLELLLVNKSNVCLLMIACIDFYGHQWNVEIDLKRIDYIFAKCEDTEVIHELKYFGTTKDSAWEYITRE